nr:hypothetical protein [Tanacetum cinerariifolium]
MTMATTIEQQVVLDEALVPSTQRLRIGKSNFRLASDIQSKESTLQVVYDVLRRCPFFKAFLVTANHIVNLETFRDMLHICPKIHGQSFDELPFEEEILDFIRNIDYAFLIWEDFVYQVEHKNHKKRNEMYYPRFTKVIIHHFMSKDLSIPRQNKVNWHYVKDDIIFSTIKVVSRHQNTQQYAPKPKANARRKRSGSDTSITPPTAITTLTKTGAVTPRLTAAGKGKQPAKAKSPSDPSELARTEAQQLKIGFWMYPLMIQKKKSHGTLRMIKMMMLKKRTEITMKAMRKMKEEIAKTNEEDDAERGKDDDEETESDEESDGDETKEEESFDPILRTPEDYEDDGNSEEDQGLRISEEERLHEEEDADELYRDSSSVSSQFVSNMLNPTSDAGMESIFATASSLMEPLQTSTPIMTPSTIATITTISHPPIPPMTIPSEVLQNLPTFDSVFGFDERLKSLEARFSAYRQTNPFAEAVSNILADLLEMELKKILIEKMEGNKSIQHSDEQRNLYKALVEAYEADKIILDTYGERVILKRRRKKLESASAPLEPVTRSAGRSTTGSKSRQASTSESAFVEEPVQTTSQIEEPSHPVFETGAEDQPIVQSSQHTEWFSQLKKPLTSDRDWNKTLPAAQGSTQTWIRELEKKVDSHSSFNELLDTPLDFFNFIMNRLRVDTLTPELLAGPTYELMKGSCNRLIELEYHLEEVYKATMDQLDWVHPEGQQYPHNLLQPLPLIPNNRGRRVIPFVHFINNDFEYLREFYGFAVNRESSLDVYSKRMIIAVTDLKIVEWHNYKHLYWILVCRDDDKIYKFKEGDFKRLRLQDIEDMLLLLKRLNLTKPDTYRSDLKRREAYTTYSNPRGFIYQNKDKKNRLIRINKLYKFSDGTLNDVRNALDDHLKGIRMQYLPQTIWRKGDKDRAATMI